jgi:hypothetical protein
MRQVCSASGAGSKSRPRRPRTPAGPLACEPEDWRACRLAKG